MRNSVLAELSASSWSLEDHADLVDGIWLPRKASSFPVSYPDDFRARLADLEESSLWFRSRNLLIRKVFERYVASPGLLEVGAGNGSVAFDLQRYGIDTVAIEPGIIGASRCAARGVQVVVAAHLQDLALPSETIRAVGLFDVIEHLEDPSVLLSDVHRILSNGGTVLVTVPALQSLWSQADIHAGHYRRYDKRSLDDVMSECGFRRVFASYFFAGALPLLFALRTLPYRRGHLLTDAQLEASLERELSGHSRLARWLGSATSRCEASWMRIAPVPFGTSVIAAYRKV